jgi:hypothetical protein
MKSDVTKQWNESDLCENSEDTYDPSAETLDIGTLVHLRHLIQIATKTLQFHDDG